MSIPRTVAEILDEHVTPEVEGIDRMYLNVYVPPLQRELGVVSFFRFYRGMPFAASALMNPISAKFIAAVETFAKVHTLPVIRFEKGQRKDDVQKEHFAKFQANEAVLFIGKAQEKTSVFRTEKGRTPQTGDTF